MPTTLPKPPELLDLPPATQRGFAAIKDAFHIQDTHTFALRSVNDPASLHDAVMLAAFAMRKLQALHHVAQPGVRTAADIVIGYTSELCRSLPELAAIAETGRPAYAGAFHTELTDVTDHLWRAGLAVAKLRAAEHDVDRVVLLQ